MVAFFYTKCHDSISYYQQFRCLFFVVVIMGNDRIRLSYSCGNYDNLIGGPSYFSYSFFSLPHSHGSYFHSMNHHRVMVWNEQLFHFPPIVMRIDNYVSITQKATYASIILITPWMTPFHITNWLLQMSSQLWFDYFMLCFGSIPAHASTDLNLTVPNSILVLKRSSYPTHVR